jgi:hypothetical protein
VVLVDGTHSLSKDEDTINDDDFLYAVEYYSCVEAKWRVCLLN